MGQSIGVVDGKRETVKDTVRVDWSYSTFGQLRWDLAAEFGLMPKQQRNSWVYGSFFTSEHWRMMRDRYPLRYLYEVYDSYDDKSPTGNLIGTEESKEIVRALMLQQEKGNLLDQPPWTYLSEEIDNLIECFAYVASHPNTYVEFR